MGPGPVVQHVGGQDGSWLFWFPFSFGARGRFICLILFLVYVGHYDQQGRSARISLGKRAEEKSATAFGGAAIIARLGCI